MSGFGRKKRHLYWSSTMNSLLDSFLYQLKHFLLITSPLMVQMILLISVISQNMFFLIFHINYVQTSV